MSEMRPETLTRETVEKILSLLLYAVSPLNEENHSAGNAMAFDSIQGQSLNND